MTDASPRARVRRDPPWHADALRLIEEGNGAARIARALEITVAKVRCWAEPRGIKLPNNSVTNRSPNCFGGQRWIMTPDMEARVLALVEAGKTVAQITDETGIDRRTLHQWAQRRGHTIFTRPYIRKGTLVALKRHEKRHYENQRAKFKVAGVEFDPVATLRSMGRADIADRLASTGAGAR